MIDIPLYQLEHARRKLDRILGSDEWLHDASDMWDHQTLRDVMDHVVEAKRREDEAHRQKVATRS